MRSAFHFNFCSFFLPNFFYHLTFHCFVSSNPVGNQLCKVVNWLEVIGLVFLARVGQKMCFSRQNVSFRRPLNVLNCFKSDSN